MTAVTAVTAVTAKFAFLQVYHFLTENSRIKPWKTKKNTPTEPRIYPMGVTAMTASDRGMTANRPVCCHQFRSRMLTAGKLYLFAVIAVIAVIALVKLHKNTSYFL